MPVMLRQAQHDGQDQTDWQVYPEFTKWCHPEFTEGCHPEPAEGKVTLSLPKGHASASSA
ncbi:MAG: hypothetical protein D6778_10410 [Nitrospirae bacterium]|nr:MAG: hypothetical protein D6778_10410 [Nitrospirota bacterium]